jgi:hypothetical protein
MDVSLQLLQDHLRDGQAKAHPSAVDVLGLGDLPEKPK